MPPYKPAIHALLLLVFSRWTLLSSLWPHGLQQARLSHRSLLHWVWSNSYPLSQWCHPTTSFCRLFLLLPSIFPSIRVLSRVVSSHHVAKVLEIQPQSFQCIFKVDFLSLQFSCKVMGNSLWPYGLQHTRLPCPSPTPGVCSNSCPSSQWCHPTTSSSVFPVSCFQSFPASGFLLFFSLRSQFWASASQSIGVSASAKVLPMNIQD